MFRVKVVTCFPRAMIPLNKRDSFWDLFEETAFCLTDRRHLADYVPLILQKEQAQIRQEIQNRHVSVILDGTSHLGEAIAIVLQFIGDGFAIEQCLV